MRTSLMGLMELVGNEGIVLAPYADHTGLMHWGIGHSSHARLPDPRILRALGPSAPFGTVSDALLLLQLDVKRCERRVRQAITRPLTQTQFDAAVSYQFHRGNIRQAEWVKRFNAGDLEGAKAVFVEKLELATLTARRIRERDIFFHGLYCRAGVATIWNITPTGHIDFDQGGDFLDMELAFTKLPRVWAWPFSEIQRRLLNRRLVRLAKRQRRTDTPV